MSGGIFDQSALAGKQAKQQVSNDGQQEGVPQNPYHLQTHAAHGGPDDAGKTKHAARQEDPPYRTFGAIRVECRGREQKGETQEEVPSEQFGRVHSRRPRDPGVSQLTRRRQFDEMNDAGSSRAQRSKRASRRVSSEATNSGLCLHRRSCPIDTSRTPTDGA